MNPRALMLICACAAFVLPATASAATKTVIVGTPGKFQETFGEKHNADVNAFFPHRIVINAGDTVSFEPSGFHNVDLPAKGQRRLDLLVAGDPISGAKDAAGAEFWFNGEPALGLNGAIFGPGGGYGKSLTYTGTTRIQSGAPLSRKVKPMEVTFPKKGTFTYFCDIHAGMKGRVRVLPKTAKAPSKRADARTVTLQVARALKEAKRISRTRVGSGVVQFGAAGLEGVESFGVFPAQTTVGVGTTLAFRMPPKSTEVHTATTGPGDPGDHKTPSYLGDMAASFESPAPDPAAIYPSERPGSEPATLTAALHGNGFWNSGVMDSVPASPLPPSNRVTFGEPGTFAFYCLIHPFMKSTVTVTA